MALDNAQFMSELSITDPPGTDPLSEGDDQIRTSKRTQQQSFPNVDKAVTTTADELNDVALQSGVNDFTVLNTFHNDNLTVRPDIADDNAVLRTLDEGGFLRWEVGRANTTTSGDWRVRRFDAAGVFQDAPVQISQSSGEATFTSDLVMELGAATFRSLFYKDAGLSRWSAGLNGSDFGYEISRYDIGGNFTNTPFTISDGGNFSFETNNLFIKRPATGGSTQVNWQNATVTRYSIVFDSVSGFFTFNAHDGAGAIIKTPIHFNTSGDIFMDLPTGPTGQSGQIYAKQSQTFIGTELVLGQTP